jgi:pilus assembly protein Flp/PilA
MFAQIRHRLLILATERRAVTAIEYALIASLVAVIIVGAVTQIGSHLTPTFNSVSSEL